MILFTLRNMYLKIVFSDHAYMSRTNLFVICFFYAVEIMLVDQLVSQKPTL